MRIKSPLKVVIVACGFVILFLAHVEMVAQSGKRSFLQHYSLANKQPALVTLSMELREISGMAFSADGRLFVHQDEHGTIFQLDPSSGKIMKRFTLGKKGVRDDFEDIAIIGDQFWMVTGGGRLYEFREGKDKEGVEFTKYETRLSAKNDVEGLCYDPATRSLLLACKENSGTGDKHSRAIYSFSLSKKQVDKKPRFVLSFNELQKKFDLKQFRPSSIVRNTQTGTFLILSSDHPAICEVSADGFIIDCITLPGSVHKQPEGLAITPDGTLLISNEGERRGMIVSYRPVQ